MLRRKEVGNPVDYFNKSFAEYKEGFESRGKFTFLPHDIQFGKTAFSLWFHIFWVQTPRDSCWYQTNWWKEVLWFFFSSGELWLGLEKLYKLTSEGNYSLRITLEDFDGKSYVAVFDQFKVITMMVNHVNDGAGWARRWLRAESGRFRRTLLHPRRLVDHSQPRWDEVQCQVREF